MYVDKAIYQRVKEKKQRLDGLRPLPRDALKRLRHQMDTRLTYNSEAIEGNTLTLQETRILLEEGITVGGKPLEHYKETANHEKALEWIESIAKQDKEIDEELILEIHGMIMNGISEYAGRYRDRQVRITGAVFTPPQPKKLPRKTTELVNWISSADLNTIERAALAHYKLVRIHPFFDGNGRVARLLMNLILIRESFPPTVLKNTDRKKYYRVLKKADKDKLEPLVDFVARAVEQSLNIYLEALEEPSEKNKLIPLREAAEHCDYSQGYLSLLSRRGKLGSTKIDNVWHVTLEDLKSYLEEHGKELKKD